MIQDLQLPLFSLQPRACTLMHFFEFNKNPVEVRNTGLLQDILVAYFLIFSWIKSYFFYKPLFKIRLSPSNNLNCFKIKTENLYLKENWFRFFFFVFPCSIDKMYCVSWKHQRAKRLFLNLWFQSLVKWQNARFIKSRSELEKHFFSIFSSLNVSKVRYPTTSVQ